MDILAIGSVGFLLFIVIFKALEKGMNIFFHIETPFLKMKLNSQVPTNKGITQCPHCNQRVKESRLATHIAKKCRAVKK
ncbi:hypothetical protein [Nostoc sp. FACHB-190]|uniref:hypothetical protein n=1 Tax=Nostoc sp. FACHB-190 TaxID=2692838 RepID=UPI00168A2820|nr:hypothetical protein [Nostoc sp. FACHB-190]MBD2302990.1 hypothetical protein [Nostoc sp. FACHB-190]